MVTGGKIIWPTNFEWLMELDPATHWLGWQFFRSSALLQWPIGANLNYGLHIGSSIVFTDSIPLLALFFKPLSPFLPDMFQYFGMWVLICFLLQSLFSWKLLSLFTQDRFLPLIGSIFFTLAPIYLTRLFVHYALFGQWVIIAALCLYFAKRVSILGWLFLLNVTVLINSYLLVMVGAIWVADLLQRIWRKELKLKYATVNLISGVAITVYIMWAAGYFMLEIGLQGYGYGHYRMNLLSLIDPNVGWSRFGERWPTIGWSRVLPDQMQGPGDYEGFGYLGLGMLGLAIVSISALALGKNSNLWSRGKKVYYDTKTIVPVLVLSVILLVFAASNRIAIGQHELLAYNLPDTVERIFSVFRATGRMIWPVYYMIYLAILYVIMIKVRKYLAIIIFTIFLCIQIVDTSGSWLHFRKNFIRSARWSSPMISPLWNDLARQYKYIVYVLPSNASPSWISLAHFAAINRMGINTGYFSRTSPLKMNQSRKMVANSITQNNLDPDSLYVFGEERLWQIASNQIGPADIAGVLDGFRLLAPKLRDCEACNNGAIADMVIAEQQGID